MFLKALFSFVSFSIHSISGGVAPCCRFSPSCSQYASEAVERFGWFHGLRLAIGRVWRCRPGGASGWDPVPAVPTNKVLEPQS